MSFWGSRQGQIFCQNRKGSITWNLEKKRVLPKLEYLVVINSPFKITRNIRKNNCNNNIIINQKTVCRKPLKKPTGQIELMENIPIF